MCMGNGLCCGWDAMYNVLGILSMADVVSLACMHKLLQIESMSSVGSLWHVWYMVCT